MGDILAENRPELFKTVTIRKGKKKKIKSQMYCFKLKETKKI